MEIHFLLVVSFNVSTIKILMFKICAESTKAIYCNWNTKLYSPLTISGDLSDFSLSVETAAIALFAIPNGAAAGGNGNTASGNIDAAVAGDAPKVGAPLGGGQNRGGAVPGGIS